jgi:hypothetical protein
MISETGTLLCSKVLPFTFVELKPCTKKQLDRIARLLLQVLFRIDARPKK